MNKFRTHKCDELRKEKVGEEVTLSGWINKKRDHGNLLFIDLRDNYGITQCIIDKENSNFKSLENQMSYLYGLQPVNVLTKLDEIMINSYDFSMYNDLDCKLGLLSGTNDIIDSIAFANSQILAQYMKEN